jgi:hypothetical protein
VSEHFADSCFAEYLSGARLFPIGQSRHFRVIFLCSASLALPHPEVADNIDQRLACPRLLQLATRPDQLRHPLWLWAPPHFVQFDRLSQVEGLGDLNSK